MGWRDELGGGLIPPGRPVAFPGSPPAGRKEKGRSMIIIVKSDVWKFRETLSELQRKQLPYAAALAVNQTARIARQTVTNRIPEIFTAKGAPTPFTMRALKLDSATKRNPAARLFVRPIQAHYLLLEETGGSRSRGPGAPLLTPVDTKLNAYGNIPRRMLKFWREHPERFFIGQVRSVWGVWERLFKSGNAGRTGHLTLLAAFRDRASWKPKFGFQEHVARSVRGNLMPALSAALARAMATAIRR
jgi:hypothetical protein